MASARELAAAATAAAREVADRAHQQAQAIADEAEQRAGSADRRLSAARGTEDALATTAARAVRSEQTSDVPEKLTDYTKAELLDIAQPLAINGASRMPKSQLVRAIRTASRSHARTRTSAR
jgi:cell division septum initiation protein DivIVA